MFRLHRKEISHNLIIQTATLLQILTKMVDLILSLPTLADLIFPFTRIIVPLEVLDLAPSTIMERQLIQLMWPLLTLMEVAGWILLFRITAICPCHCSKTRAMLGFHLWVQDRPILRK